MTPASALQDVPLRITLSGLAPSSRITIAAEMTGRDGTRWRSRAVFRADEAGAIDVARTRPAEGAYQISSAMGLIWSMTTEPTAVAARPKRLRDPVDLAFSASTGTGASMQAWVKRLSVDDEVAFRALDPSSRLRGGWWLPAGSPPHPCVIVLGGSGGGADHDRAALYASHGFAALALAYFGAPGLPRGLVNIPLEYVGDAIELALATIRPPRDFVAIDGISRGGELALLVGSTFQILASTGANPTR